MLEFVSAMSSINIGELKAIYCHQIADCARNHYGHQEINLQYLNAEQDFFEDLKQFLRIEGARYALWRSQGRCVAAMRLEPYLDGILITDLETAPEERCKGYATQLLMAVRYAYPDMTLYSHIAFRNMQAIHLHQRCGFIKHLDYAIFVDGSIFADHCTYICKKSSPSV